MIEVKYVPAVVEEKIKYVDIYPTTYYYKYCNIVFGGQRGILNVRIK